MGTEFVLHSDTVTNWLVALTLLSTSLLAFFTWRMARATKRLAVDSEAEFEIAARSANAAVEAAKASVRQTEISERSLQSLVRPWITAGEYVWDDEDGSQYPSRLPLVTLQDVYADFALTVSVKLQNVGPGIALIDARKSWLLGRSQNDDPDEIKPFVNSFTETPVVPSQSTFYVVGQVPASGASARVKSFETVLESIQ